MTCKRCGFHRTPMKKFLEMFFGERHRCEMKRFLNFERQYFERVERAKLQLSSQGSQSKDETYREFTRLIGAWRCPCMGCMKLQYDAENP